MARQVARIGDRAVARVRVGDTVVTQYGRVISGARRTVVEGRSAAYMRSRVKYPNTIGYITSRVATRTIIEGRQAALLRSRVTGGAIVCCGQVITAARRVLAG